MVTFSNFTIVSHTPTESIEHGVGMVHQHFMLVPSFTVAQNIVLSKEPRKNRFFYDLKGAEKAVSNLVDIAAGRCVNTVKNIHQSTLACTIFSNQRENFALPDIKGNVIICQYARKLHGDSVLHD